MKRIAKVLIICSLFGMGYSGFAQVNDNALTKKQKKTGFELMFDGKTLSGWRGFAGTDIPDVWFVDKGMLCCRKVDKKDAKPGEKGFIIYDEQFEDFHLKLEWKISEAGNSGVFYRGQESGYSNIIETAPEMQILDNEKALDSNRGLNGNRRAGSLYDLIPASPQNANPAGEWNQIEIIVKNNKVTHIQNGKKVVEY